MEHLLIRGLVAVPLAILLPLGLPTLPRPARRALLAAAIVFLAVAADWGHWQAWAIVLCATAAAAVPVPDRHRPWALLCAAGGALAAVVLLAGAQSSYNALGAVVGDWRVTVVLAGGLACVFIGGAAIGSVLHPFAERVGNRRDVAGMEDAGRVIGWIERALLYALLLAGAPGAAAFVIAAKSLARFPLFKEERFAEYYVIGSLLSFAIAFAVALAVRAAIGLQPIAPL